MSIWFECGGSLVTRLVGDERALAAFAVRVLEVDDELDVRWRSGSVTVRLRGAPDGWGRRTQRLSIEELADDCGLQFDPGGFIELGARIHCTDPVAGARFWAASFGLDEVAPGKLVDAGGRSPTVEVVPLPEPRPARSRIHFDVSAPLVGEDLIDAALAAGGGKGVAPWAHADADGTEVDLIGREPADPQFPDWVAMFTGVVRYLGPPEATRGMVSAVADIVTKSRFEMAIDVRRESDGFCSVVIDVGKDRWMLPGFRPVAVEVERAARALGLIADLAGLRFVQYGIDVAEHARVSPFWQALLGWRPAEQEGLTDLLDPELTGPSLITQGMEPDPVRTAQSNRVELLVTVAPQTAAARIAAATAVGGQVLAEAAGADGQPRWSLSDPEGNQVEITEGRGFRVGAE